MAHLASIASIGWLDEVEVAHGVLDGWLNALAHGGSLHGWDWLLHHLVVHGGITHSRHVHLVLLLGRCILRRHAVWHGWGRGKVRILLLLLLLLLLHLGVGWVSWRAREDRLVVLARAAAHRILLCCAFEVAGIAVGTGSAVVPCGHIVPA